MPEEAGRRLGRPGRADVIAGFFEGKGAEGCGDFNFYCTLLYQTSIYVVQSNE